MNAHEQEKAIAKACGWKDVGTIDWQKPGPEAEALPIGHCNKYATIPKYCSDLNACNEFEKTLSKDEQGDYETTLINICRDRTVWRGTIWPAIHATAAQRSEAFLKIKGILKEESV